ncbi:hypothetical protein GH714_008167 [Hevea brasiliensis]|uniref:PPM-type phosphatase domain-containing protein n=1 Tax=Hevea brasiliensis TaxID=3981 RepID=A0A6A6KYS3_HEVBR|nr:hypothetical protein GH714_008167 [Hevea brasiliensis]
MGLEIVEPNTCIRGCCSSNSIPLHLPASSYALLSPIARGAESVVYEGILDGRKVAVKKLFLSTSEDIDKFHKELQLICITSYSTTMSLDHLGIAKLVAAHAKPPSYLFFFKFYESGNLVGNYMQKNGVRVLISELHTGVVPYAALCTEAEAHTVLEMNYTEQQLTAAVVSSKLKKSMEENFAPGASSVLEIEHFIYGANNLRTFHESVNWSTQGKQLSKKASLAVNSRTNNWLDSLNEPLAYHPVLSWGSFATCGRREIMEDAHFLMPHMCNEKVIHVFGAAAAEFSVQALPGFPQSLASIRSPIDALFEAFVSTDAAFRNEINSHRKSRGVVQKDWHPGCTAVAALIVRNKLLLLMLDHVASCLEEREHAISAGGQVKWQVDTGRVGPAAL